jgi:probable HAF family extracellular repeat protein
VNVGMGDDCWRAVLYDSATQQMQDLGNLRGEDYPRGVFGSVANGINDSDKVVGVSGIRDGSYGGSRHAFLKESGQPMIDLNTLLPADSGWTIGEATAITSDIKIAAYGYKDGVGSHALLLTPTSDIPPPPTITSPQNNTLFPADSHGSFSVSGSAEAGSTVELFEGETSKGTTKADSSSSGAWSIDLSGVSEGTPHTYFAKVKDAAGNTSFASNSVTVTVEDKTALTISGVDPASGATGVVRNPDIHAKWSEKMDPATLTTSTVTLVKDGTEGTTPISARVFYDDYYYNSVVLTPSPPEIKAPTNLTATVGGTTRRPQVSLKWTDNSNEDKFGVERSEDNGKTWKELSSSLAANTTGYTDKTVVCCNKTYTYRVKGLSSPLEAYTKYTAKITGGTNGVKDLAGNQLGGGNQASGDYWWSFTTGNLPATNNSGPYSEPVSATTPK